MRGSAPLVGALGHEIHPIDPAVEEDVKFL